MPRSSVISAIKRAIRRRRTRGTGEADVRTPAVRRDDAHGRAGRYWLWLRGLWFRERDPSEVSAGQLTRIDVLWSAAFSISFVDTVLGAMFQARHLLAALAAGDPYRIARAMCLEVGHVAAGGASWSVTSALMARSRDVAARARSPLATALTELGCGVALFTSGRFRECLPTLQRAQSLLRDCSGSAFEVASAQYFIVYALGHVGRLREQRTHQEAYLRAARARGDVYAAVNLQIAYATYPWLMEDDPKGARREAKDALEQWTPRGFHVEHQGVIMSLVDADLYDGDPAGAYARMRDCWGELQRSLLLRVKIIRNDMMFARGRSAVALAALESKDRVALLASARRDARVLESEGTAYARILALLLMAGVDRIRGRDDAAASHLSAAASLAEDEGLLLYLHCARHALGTLRRDETLTNEADRWFREQGVREPARFVRTFVAGCA